MRRKFAKLSVLAILTMLSGCQSVNIDQGVFSFKDADNFAKLLKSNSSIDAQVLQTQYLDIGSEGVRIFTPDRIESAENLSKNITANIEDYRHAINVCLPIVKTLSGHTNKVLKNVANMLGETSSAPTYVLFGANNSGGTARENGLAIGLEVSCKGATKETYAKSFIRLVAHEVIHVYQSRSFDKNAKIDLLYAAIAEGGADFIAQLAVGSVDATISHEIYGKANEKAIWKEFRADLENGVMDNSDWFYRPGRNGRPKDLGYYFGRRISEEYYARAADKQKALRDLIEMKDTHQILADSHLEDLQR